ncbi:MAG: hypothetical protein WD036_07070 [Bauldia sp.]
MFRTIATAAAALVMAVALAGPAAAATWTGSRGMPTIQKATWDSLEFVDEVVASNCKSRKLVGAKVTKNPTGLKFRGEIPVAGKWSEQWTMSRCGKEIRYALEFVFGADGRTRLNIKDLTPASALEKEVLKALVDVLRPQ